MDYIPKHFQPFEVVPREVHKAFETSNQIYKIWWLFDPRILKAADRIRDRYGRMTCNDWFWGGNNHYRGWRPPGCNVGAKYSQHRFGRALDLVPTEVTAEDIRRDIKAGEDFGNAVTCIEDRVSWLHIDCRNYEGLLIVHP